MEMRRGAAPALRALHCPAPTMLPQYRFAHAATESPVLGGNADTRYFTIVYGMIRSHMREPSGERRAEQRGRDRFHRGRRRQSGATENGDARAARQNSTWR